MMSLACSLPHHRPRLDHLRHGLLHLLHHLLPQCCSLHLLDLLHRLLHLLVLLQEVRVCYTLEWLQLPLLQLSSSLLLWLVHLAAIL